MSDHEYVPQPWRMSGYYPDQYAKSMSALGVGIDYADHDYERYEARFLNDLAAHDAKIHTQAREDEREAIAVLVDDCAEAAATLALQSSDATMTDALGALADSYRITAQAIRNGEHVKP